MIFFLSFYVSFMKLYAYHAARFIAAIILLQTLYFKFTAHPESVALFTEIGMEPWGRIGIGIVELLAWILLILGKNYSLVGAVLWIGLMLWALYFHLTILGIDQLFWMAVVTLVCCIYVVIQGIQMFPVQEFFWHE